MILLVLFAFLAGIVTLLSPCILPILPIILSGSVTGGKKRPLGIVTGFILSFTFFTLFLTSIVKLFNIPADSLRSFSIGIILIFGLTLLIPPLQRLVDKLFVRLTAFSPKANEDAGFFGGMLIGVSIGLVWTPCVGPILASVISLALTGTVNGTAVIITLAYAIGTALPMLGIVYGGKNILNKVPFLVRNTARIQQGFGAVMILVALSIFFNLDRQFQTYILQKFPNYGVGLTSLEDNQAVKNQLNQLTEPGSFSPSDMGKPTSDLLQNQGRAPEIIPGGEWFNLPSDKQSVSLASLRGKVVLIDFWTYTCINCIRTLPYLKTWHEKYTDDGLVIIGVHTPEFEFEKSPKNVAKAIKDFNLPYIVVQDNDYSTWRAYSNRYWPAKYFIDKDGNIRYHHFGEGKYDESEKVIQDLLKEIGSDQSQTSIENPSYKVESRSPEMYLGYSRMQNLASPERVQKDTPATYSSPSSLGLNRFSLEGEWTITPEYSQPKQGSTLKLHYYSKDVFLVMRPKENSGQVKVILDGEEQETILVDSDRLYELIKLDTASDHTIILEFLDSNLELFAFTFG